MGDVCNIVSPHLAHFCDQSHMAERRLFSAAFTSTYND
jgi:hypothetical protein